MTLYRLHLRSIKRTPIPYYWISRIPKYRLYSMYPQPQPPAVDTSAVNGVNGSTSHKEFNAWQQPGPAAFDFRSDTMTTPNASMLQAIINTTLMDDVFQEDPTTNELHKFVASLTGHEAALLVMSGTMGNQVAIRSHLSSPPHSILCDHRSHVFVYEAGGSSAVSGALTIPIRPSNGHHLTLEDIESHCIISNDIHSAPTKLICLENTLNGMVMPLSEIKRISAFARENNILLHLDGARLWEVVASQAGTLQDFASNFDSVSLCFSKGLGAPIGSILVGSATFIDKARHIRKMIGGGIRQAGVISAAAKVAVEEVFGHGPNGEGGQLQACHVRAKQIAAQWEKGGGKLTNPVETNMVWIDLKEVGWTDEEFAALAKENGIKAFGGRLVIHYQITGEAIDKLVQTLNEVLQRRKSYTGKKGSNRH